MRSLRARTAAAVIACGTPTLSLSAQVIRGSVVDSASRQPVVGVAIVLLDDSARPVLGALGDTAGRFAIQAPNAGRYRLQVQRIGYRSTLSNEFVVASGQSVDSHLVVQSVPVTLARVVTVANPKCVTRPTEGMAAAVLWEEMRKALYATVLSQDQRLLLATVEDYERDLGANDLSLLVERRSTRTGVTSNPYESAPATDLSRGGYVQRKGDTTWYYAPDAHVLLSDSFLDDHCFRIQRPDSAHRGLIGLAFEPDRGRKLPDIRGVLWADLQTAELRYLEYAYTALPRGLRDHKLGGGVELGNLPNGAWMVQSWWVRAPRTASDRRRRITMGEVSGRTVLGAVGPGEEVVTTIKEEGGRIVALSLEGKAIIGRSEVDPIWWTPHYPC